MLSGFNVVAYWRDVNGQKALRKALSLRDGAIIPLVTCPDQMPERLRLERHVCINTTASGGNVALLN